MPSFRAASSAVLAGGSSYTCPKPTSPGTVVAGDILVAFHGANGGNMSTLGTPTGGATWNLLASREREDGPGNGGTKVWWKVAGAAEPASYGFTHSSGYSSAVSIVAVQGAFATAPLVQQDGSAVNPAATSVTTPSTTLTSGDGFEIRCGVTLYPGTLVTWLPPSGFVERTDVQASTDTSMSTATRALTIGGATGTHYFTVSPSQVLRQGFTVSFLGASAPQFAGWGMPITF